MLLNLDMFNNLLNNSKENNLINNFIKELSEFMEKNNNKICKNDLQQENCLYQVVDFASDGVYLQHINNNKIY